MAVLVLVPTMALAANTATFSSRTPGSGSSTLSTRPTMSVNVYDRYGVHGSGTIAMTLDGKSVKPSVVYYTSGSFDPAHPNYRSFKVSYRAPSAMKAGTHKVYVRVKDKKGRISTLTWSFKITVAEAPYSAVFSSPAPAASGSVATTMPGLSIAVYDKYGVTGSGTYSLSVDGVAISTAIKYSISGNYTAFTLSGKPARALAYGPHTATAKVTDTHNHVTTYSWPFTIPTPAPVFEDMPGMGTTCTDCHTGYPSTHPMTNCQLCHGTGRPVAGTAYTPASTSAHTLACSLAPCHRTPQPFPHVLGSDCTSCHEGQFSGIPVAHSSDVAALHTVSSSFCTSSGCHLTSLTKEHYRYTVNGAKLSCATCHDSADSKVAAAIANHSTTCTDCHDLSGGHPTTTTQHAAAATCVRSACHASDVATIHKGNCAACHAAGKTPSTTCSTCHATGTYHANASSKHAATNSCTVAGCHAAGDVSLIHVKNGVQHCEACHADGKTPTTDCTSCHGSQVLDLHPNAASSHTAALVECTTSACHGQVVTTIHKTGDTYNCSACHKADGSTPTTTCSSCHTGDVASVHSGASAQHTASGVSCVSAACHATNVSLIHVKNGVSKCSACHGPGITPTTDCTQCHAGSLAIIHAAAGTNHTATLATCVTAGCHAADVTQIHTNKDGSDDCSACHSGAVPPANVDCTNCHAGDVTSLHAKADPLHAAPSTMCQTVCHSSNVAQIHSAYPVGCTACHAAGKTASTTCASCHSGTVKSLHSAQFAMHVTAPGTCVSSLCHSTDVIATHDPLGTGEGCARCHGPGKVPSLDCTSCHGTDILNLHPNVDTKHAAPAGTTCVSATCHEANVMQIHNHEGGPGCAACHKDGTTPSTDCSKCHSTDTVVVHAKAQVKHTVAAGGGCSTPTCHQSGNVSVIHVKNGVQHCEACHKPGATLTIACSECHAPANVPAIHSFAEASHEGTLTTCVKSGCHDGNVAVIHQGGPGCGVCHGAGAPTTLNCTNAGCHSANLTTVHAKAAIPHTAPAGYCVRSNCHGGDLASIHDANGTGIGCAACHNNPDHAPSSICTDCHPSTDPLAHASADTSHTVPQSTCAGYTGPSPCHHGRVDSIHRVSPLGCRSCHTAPGTVPTTTTCADCHKGTTAPTHASAESSHTAATGLCVNAQCHATDVSAIHAKSTSSCLACHGPNATASTDCTSCHTADPLYFPKHAAAATAHVTPSGLTCTAAGCHDDTSVTTIHAAVGCTVCHNGTVTATTDCTSSQCHGSDFTALHAKGDSFHITSGSCLKSGCHTGNAVQLHAGGPNCAACHDNPDHAASVVCANCHPGTGTQAVHASYIGTKHDPQSGPCTAPGCHATSVANTHSTPAGVYSQSPPPGCTPCHTTGPLTLDCLACHTANYSSAHASEEGTHTAPTGTCVKSGCHDSNVTLIHVKGGVPKCQACHNGSTFPSLDCKQCHFGGFTSEHPAPAAAHTTSAVYAVWCTQSGCHDKNVAILHTTQLAGGPTPPGCDACHAAGKTPSLDCSASGCHPAAVPNQHVAPVAQHTSTDGCTGLCHQANVATLHLTNTGSALAPGCVACHAYAKSPSTTCASCHSDGTYHQNAAAKHVPTAASCTVAGCHDSGDVSSIHVKNGVKHCEACHAVGKTPSTNCSDAACHATFGGNHTAAHAECNNCHYDPGHWDWAAENVGDGSRPCLDCHGTPGAIWRHPDLDCHGSCHGWLAGYSWTMTW